MCPSQHIMSNSLRSGIQSQFPHIPILAVLLVLAWGVPLLELREVWDLLYEPGWSTTLNSPSACEDYRCEPLCPIKYEIPKGPLRIRSKKWRIQSMMCGQSHFTIARYRPKDFTSDITTKEENVFPQSQKTQLRKTCIDTCHQKDEERGLKVTHEREASRATG